VSFTLRCEEPHSAAPELWAIDGTELDLAGAYKLGGQMWYLQVTASSSPSSLVLMPSPSCHNPTRHPQDRARDAIKAGRPINGRRMSAALSLCPAPPCFGVSRWNPDARHGRRRWGARAPPAPKRESYRVGPKVSSWPKILTGNPY
jgi:hypothetical protein